MPLVVCPTCGPWGADGVEFPSIGKSALPLPLQNLGSQPIPIDEWLAIEDRIAIAGKVGIEVLPGAAFGPLRGSPLVLEPGFVWRSDWSVLMDEGCISRFRNARCELLAVPTPAKTESGFQVLEVEARPGVSIAKETLLASGVQVCSRCGRYRGSLREPIFIEYDDEHQSVPIQRVRGFSTIVVVNEAFAAAIERSRLTGARLVPVQAKESKR